MRAIQMTAIGGPDVLRLAEVPEPRLETSTQVKIRLRAAGINPIDTKVRGAGIYVADRLPAVLGLDGAGEVVEVGSGVTRLKVGDAVWLCNGGLGEEPGTYAEFVVADEAVVRLMPGNASYAEAAAAPLVLITAWESLFDRAHLHEGHTLLVHAGAGGVGHVAVQLARHAGARIAATASAENAGFLREVGVERVIDYHAEDFVAAVLEWTDGQGVNVCLDAVGGETFARSVQAVAHYGDLVTLLEPPESMSWRAARLRNLRVGFDLMLTPLLGGLPAARAHQADILDNCAVLFEAGELRVHVGARYLLEDVALAHAELQAGHTRGKRVLLM
ncbi:MAG: zinc-binding dehydrogenase [Acidihalobacter sp.]